MTNTERESLPGDERFGVPCSGAGLLVCCPDCGGSRLDSSGSNDCQLCGGDGEVCIGDVVYDAKGWPEAVINEDGKVQRVS